MRNVFVITEKDATVSTMGFIEIMQTLESLGLPDEFRLVSCSGFDDPAVLIEHIEAEQETPVLAVVTQQGTYFLKESVDIYDIALPMLKENLDKTSWGLITDRINQSLS